MRPHVKVFALIVAMLFIVNGCGHDVLNPLAREHCSTPPTAEGNVGNVINSVTDDYAPKLVGDRLIYSSGVTIPGKHPKAFQSEWLLSEHSATLTRSNVSRGWDQPEFRGATPLQSIALNLNEGSFEISNDGSFAIYAAERELPGSGQSALFDLYEVPIDGSLHATAAPHALDGVNDPDAWDSQPALTASGDTLFFVSDRNIRGEGPRGATHIWVSHRWHGSWTKPALLPKPYTTSGAEMSPHVGPDGEFYFSSNGSPDGLATPKAMGGFDIYRAAMTNGMPSGRPIRLPQPFNSTADDDFPFISKDQRTVFWSSTRDGGCGEHDIYAAVAPQVVILQGTINRSELSENGWTKPSPTTGVVNVVELSPNGSVQQSVSILTGNDGGYAVAIHPNQKYSIGVDNKDCYEVDGPFTISTAALGLWDTTYIRQDFTVRYQPLHVELNSAIVPFFVTGFWRLNTRAGYQQFARRYSPIGDLEHLTNINGHDYNYAEGSATVDRVLDDSVYTPILNRLLPQLTRSCYDSNYYLDIAVTGFTDRSPITDGDSNLYRDSDVVHYGDSTLHSGDRLNGPQAGNVKLSVLRAYYAEKEILAALMRDATFAKYYSEGRIEIHSHGAGISEKYSDLAHNRRIDITASVVRRR